MVIGLMAWVFSLFTTGQSSITVEVLAVAVMTDAHPPKDPEAEYQGAFYRCPDGRPAVPTLAFKNAAVDAATQVSGLTKTYLRGVFHTVGELVAIEGTPQMREDMVRVGMGTADIRYRPEFPEWAVRLRVRFNIAAISLEQLIHLFNCAGFAVGVCEWRPQRDGAYGMFHVAGVEEVDDSSSLNGQGSAG